MPRPLLLIFFFLVYLKMNAYSLISLGSEQLMEPQYAELLKGKRIGLITNHTAINSRMQSSYDFLKSIAAERQFTIAALFAPEHGITGSSYAGEKIEDSGHGSLPVYSLHGKTQRPNDQMLKGIDVLIYDIQDIGSRSYTYISTLFFVMEEAAKRNIPVIVLDRPNPINGITIDGPLLKDRWRSILGYINVPYCHGLTVGELAAYFNSEYNIGCKLRVIPMKGWKRKMSFHETGLPWIPTSPNVPEATTAYYYPTTGLLGELGIVNIGVGYTLPFKLVGAPWIKAQEFADALNAQKCPGVSFKPFYYKPFFGRFAQEECQGALIIITNYKTYKPVSTQYTILGVLKNLYPKEFAEGIQASKDRHEIFNKVNGTDEVLNIIVNNPHIMWPLRQLHQKDREQFIEKRKKYLIADYQ